LLAVRNSYDQAGRLIKVESGTLAAVQPENVAPADWTGFTPISSAETQYAQNRKIRAFVREGPSSGSGQAGPVRALTEFSYDIGGRPECAAVRMNPALFAFTGTPDACVPNPPGTAPDDFGPDRIARNVYDLAGQRIQLREGVGSAVEAAEASWAYNLNGQPVTVIDGNGNRAELRYDGHMRQDRWTFPGAARAAAYDDATQASALASAGAVNPNDYEAYTYDPAGNRTSLRKRDGTTLTYQYDNLNRLILKAVPERAGLAATHSRDVYYGYDLRNLQLYARFDSAAGEGVTNGYDPFGRLTSSILLMDGTARALGYSWDASGNRTRLVHPDGSAFATLYDGLNRPVWMGTEGVNGIASVVYLPRGAPLALNRLGASLAFDYDGLQRQVVRGFLFPAAAGNVTWVHSYNPAGGIASETRDNDAYAWTHAYNAARPYATNGLNQYVTTGQPNAAGSVAFAYDSNGNLASEAAWNGSAHTVSTTYTYDIENRLIAAGGSRTSPCATTRSDGSTKSRAYRAQPGSSMTVTRSWRNMTRPARCCAAMPTGPAQTCR
jgi:YD repeat-containing protein